MFAQALARRLSRAGVHYGWAIVAIVFFLALTTNGCMGISGALIAPLTKEFGWSTEQISDALVLRIVLFGLTAALIAKYGRFARSTFDTYLPAFYIAGVACLIAAAAGWLIGRTQSAGERLVGARA